MRRGLRILLFSDAFLNLALGMIGPIYAIFVEQIGGDILDASWTYFAYMFTAGVVLYLISRWENRTKHKEKLVVLGFALSTIGCFSYIFVHDQFSLFITQVILGVATAVLSPAFDTVFSHYVETKHEASDWGSWESLYYITTALAALMGGYIASSLGFRSLFIIMFIFSLFATIRSISMLQNKKYLRKLL